MSLVAGSLMVPLVVWSKKAPVHRISSLCVMPNFRHLITGTHDGQICLWEFDEGTPPKPMYMLFGNVTAILCLAPAEVDENSTHFISCAQSGKVCLWDVKDGRCVESAMSNYIHTSVQAHTFRLGSSNKVRLLCVGHYSEILVMDPESLQILFSLASRVEPDWISAFHVVKPPQKPDIVVGVSNAGMVKIWSLSSVENKTLSNPVYEDESKQVQCFSACALIICPFNPRTMLIVCNKIWQIFDAYDFSLCCSASSPVGHRWLGGNFVRIDKTIVWSSNGNAYLYQLPRSKLKGKAVGSVVGSEEISDEAVCYCVLKLDPKDNVPLYADPAFFFRQKVAADGSLIGSQLLVRGDSEGKTAAWKIPEVSDKAIMALKQEKFVTNPELFPVCVESFARLWPRVRDQCPGIIRALSDADEDVAISTTLYVPSQGRLVLGRQDGTIVIVAATHTLMKQFLKITDRTPDWPMYRRLSGHNGAVTCLLYPHEENGRYEVNHLMSGGADFCVCLWDLNSGSLIHRFCVQAGEILRLLVPPENCTTKVSQSVCSVASDHSVALLGLKDQRCILLASRHLFPVKDIRWRPLDDFLLIHCEDGTVYVWQMETAHLDRVLTGIIAEEALSACQEQIALASASALDSSTPSTPVALTIDERNKNGSSIKRSGSSLPADGVGGGIFKPSDLHQYRNELAMAPPMLVQGVRCNENDGEFHIVLFNIESLILSLLVDEHAPAASSTPATPAGQSGGNVSPRFSEFLSKAKETAENVLKGVPPPSSLKPDDGHRRNVVGGATTGGKQLTFAAESSLNAEIAQLLLSILHAWELDADLDSICSTKLGLAKPKFPVSYGLISREGHLTLLLPRPPTGGNEFAHFARNVHWSLSSSLTTQHLLSVVSAANTLMSTNNAGFSMDYEKRRRILKHQLSSAGSTKASAAAATSPNSIQLSSEILDKLKLEQSQIKQGWSTLATVHCVLLPDLAQQAALYASPRVELLARRWEERCLELREAAQALLLRELSRVGAAGRKALIDEWAPFLPTMVDPAVSILGSTLIGTSAAPSATAASTPASPAIVAQDDPMSAAQRESTVLNSGAASTWDPVLIHGDKFESPCTLSSNQPSVQQIRRNQATAVVLLGVIGAEYGQEMAQAATANAGGVRPQAPEGFGSNNDYTLARATSQSLLELLLQPPSSLLPPFSSLRRAAIDLIGRGFAVWQPYLDISKVLLALLELCANGDRLLPANETAYFPLSPQADACRTARQALTLIASARPPAFVTALNKEVARFNAMSQHQTVHVGSPLVRAKKEILRIVEMLSDKMYPEMVDLMIPTGEVLVHCMDVSLLKTKNMAEYFPPMAKFPMISYCGQSKRVAFGGKTGSIVIHELRAGKSQTVQAHSKAVSACSFSEDGKLIVTYSSDEGKVNFWQMSQSFMGMGQSQIKCVKQHPAPSSFPVGTPSNQSQSYKVKLVWISAKAVTLLLPNGSEHRFSI